MDQRVPPEQYPWWVKLTMTGAATRSRMWLFFALSIGIGLVALSYGFLTERLYWQVFGPIALLLAVLYPIAIRWIDRHGSWPQ